MAANQSTGQSMLIERYDYGDRQVLAVDLGPAARPDIDVVDGTLILVDGDDHREIALPDGEVQAFNRNGVVSIEVEG